MVKVSQKRAIVSLTSAPNATITDKTNRCECEKIKIINLLYTYIVYLDKTYIHLPTYPRECYSVKTQLHNENILDEINKN